MRAIHGSGLLEACRSAGVPSGWGRLAIVAVILFSTASLVVMFAGAQPTTQFEWDNTTWRHRVGFEVTANTETEDWPIERGMNFTALLEGENDTGEFDNDSIRVVEYDSNGNVLRAVPYQFDRAENYNTSTNAHGTLTFMLNGTTTSGTTRYFFVYFDSVGKGPKPSVSFPVNIESSFGGEELSINTSKFRYRIDTRRGDNLSGMYAVIDRSFSAVLEEASESNRPAEYTEFTNGTHGFTFNLSKNATIEQGPHRVTVTQRGFIDFYNVTNETGDLSIVKRYRFYNNSGEGTSAFVKIEQEIRNVGGRKFNFSSTSLGAVALDVNRTWGSANTLTINFENRTDPFSFVRVHSSNLHAGVININESDEALANFTATSHLYEEGRVGINLTDTTLNPGESAAHTTFFSAGSFTQDGRTEFANLVDMFKNQPTVAQKDADTYSATVEASTNATVYNLNETIRVIGNMTSDAFNVTANVSAVLNRNTTSTSDDATLILSHNGDSWKVWSYIFHLQDDSNLGRWSVNVTAETSESILLDRNQTTFTVTDEYFANLTLRNAVEVVGDRMKANLTLKTFRQDLGIKNAVVRCGFDGSEVQDVSEFGNGIYRINFSAPSPPDDYTLACNGTKDGNLGNDTALFTSQVANVVVNTSFIPPSFDAVEISRVDSQNFTFVVNASNPDNGTAHSTNISFTPPQGWTLNTSVSNCGDILSGGFCTRNVSAEIPSDTLPGNFSINTTVEWINPDDSFNQSNDSFPVEVLPNPVLNVSENIVEGRFGGGRSEKIGNFTVLSIGNANLSNVNVSCVAGSGQVCDDFNTSFSPTNISEIDRLGNRTVNVTVHVPKTYTPGLYNGTVNVSSDKSFDVLNLSVDVIGSTTVATDTIPPDNVKADNVTLNHNQTVQFDSNSTNTGEAFAFSANVSVSLPSGWGANTTSRECGDLNTSESCTRTFFPEIPNATSPANYTVTANTTWLNPDGNRESSTQDITVVVEENPVQEVPEESLNGTVTVDDEAEIGNFTLFSTGNFNVSNATFTCQSGDVCDNFTSSFDPPNVSTLGPGANRTVLVNVTVPARFPAGVYNGTLNVSSTGGFDLLTLNVTVPATRKWTIDRQLCQKSSEPVAGTACSPVINNTGNVDLNITITPSSANNTSPEPQNFSVPFESSREFNITYNVTGAEEQVHNATYNVSTLEEATPRWRALAVSILPAVPPVLNVSVEPALIRQNGTVSVIANVTATSGFPLDQVRANVTQPGNVSVEERMTRVRNYSSDTSLWRIFYPNGSALNGSSANTTLRGVYTVNVTANDTLTNTNFTATNFTVAVDLSTTLETVQPTYDQGDTGSITYNLSDLFGNGIGGAEVNLSIFTPNGFFLSTKFNPLERITSSGSNKGHLDPRPTFSLADDAPIGVYDLIANASWQDPVTDRSEGINASTTFAVGKGGDFKVRWDTGKVWFENTNFTAYMAVTKGGNRIDADTINLTVYDPDRNVFFSFNDTQVHRKGRGLYQAWKSVPNNPDLGIYWSKLFVEDEGETAIRFRSFRMAEEAVATGPFDISIDLLEQSENPGEFLDFNLTVINQGARDGDSKITYWVTRNNTQYSFISETIFTPGNTGLTIPRSIFIFGDQPFGTYRLNAKVEPLDSSIAPATAAVTFEVVEVPEGNVTVEEKTVTETRTVQEEAPPAEVEPVRPNISIIDAPREINLARGNPVYRPVTVANTGDTAVENLTLSVVGMPSRWTSVQPSESLRLSRAETTTFTVLFDVPGDAERSDYNLTFLATSNLATAQKTAEARVFRSIRTKILEDIERIGDRVEELRVKMDALSGEGADVSGVEAIVVEIEARIESANRSVREGDFESALQDVSEADSLLIDAQDELDKVEVPGRRDQFRFFPVLVGALLLLALVLTVVYFVRVRSVKPFEEVQERIDDVFREMRKRSQKEAQELREKKRKTRRLIDLLEAQHEEGIMADATYRELKSSAEEKLRRINSRLEES